MFLIYFAFFPKNVPLFALSSFPQPSWGVEGVEAAWRRRHFYQGYSLDNVPLFNF
jgi:hypothetical protein